jgi:hypothetical protein
VLPFPCAERSIMFRSVNVTPATSIPHEGRPQLLAVNVPAPDLAAYSALTSTKGVKP